MISCERNITPLIQLLEHRSNFCVCSFFGNFNFPHNLQQTNPKQWIFFLPCLSCRNDLFCVFLRIIPSSVPWKSHPFLQDWTELPVRLKGHFFNILTRAQTRSSTSAYTLLDPSPPMPGCSGLFHAHAVRGLWSWGRGVEGKPHGRR